MNAYLVDAGEYVDPTGGGGRDISLVFAESPGRAKGVACRGRPFGKYSYLRYSDYLDLRVYLVVKGVDREKGMAGLRDSLWDEPCPGLERAMSKEVNE